MVAHPAPYYKDETMKKRDEIFNYIVYYKERHDGGSPTYQDICNNVSLRSKSNVLYHLRRLEKDDRLILCGRHIQVVGGRWAFG